MRFKFSSPLIVFLAAFLLLSPRLESAVITGKVQNGSAQLKPIRHCDVRLTKFSKRTFEPQVIDSLRTNSQGLFRFRRVESDSAAVYVVSARFLGVSYFSGILQILRPDTVAELAITAYDTTSQVPNITVQMHHVFAERDTMDVLFREVLVIHSASDKTYMGQRGKGHFRKTLAFSIPPDAYAFQSESGLDLHRAVQEAQTLYDVQPLVPGVRQVSYVYRLAAEDGQVHYSRTLDCTTRVFSFFISDPTVKVESPALHREDNFVIRGRQYVRLAGENLSAGTKVEVTITGAGATGKRSVWWMLLFGLLVVAIVGFSFVALSRRSKAEQAGLENSLIAEREALLHEIAALDDAHEEGKIEETEYWEKRQSLKADLIQITGKLRSGANPPS